MAIIIQTQQPGIPVKIGELEFSFDTSDAALESLQTKHQAIMKEIDQVQDGDDDAAKKVLSIGFDLLLGDGAFKRIYKQTSSIIDCTKILFQLLQEIESELSMFNKTVTQHEKAQQYLQAKKKKKRKK